jgi:putative ABC transport system permease protein
MQTWWPDLRYALRTLGANPAFTLVAVTALAVGMGANAAIFTIMNGALSWNLGLDHVDRMVVINTVDASRSPMFEESYSEFRYLRAQSRSFAGLAAYQFAPVNVSGAGALPERFDCVKMTANGFAVAEQKPEFGRDFTADDERQGTLPVVILAHHVWAGRFGKDPAILGKTVRVDEVPMTVIGVMPPGRRFPEETDLWTPLIPEASLEKRDTRSLMVFGRLAEGVSAAAARLEIAAISRRLAAKYPATNAGLTAEVVPIAVITGAYAVRPLLRALWVAVGFVLLIACADVSNMLLARGTERAREISIRVAIGAGRSRIIRQLLVESLAIATAAGVAAWWIAIGGLRWFGASIAAAGKPIWLNLSLDRSAFLYLAVISIGSGILFGLAPALRLAQIEIHTILKDGGLGAAGSRRSRRLSNLLVIAEMALCIVLLMGAGLAIQSAARLYAAPLGINPQSVLTMRLNLPEAKYARPQDLAAFHRSLHGRLESLPGVESVAAVSNLPLGQWLTLHGAIESPGQRTAGETPLRAVVAGPHYFDVLQVRPRAGRLFDERDDRSGPPVAVVNETFAAKFWPGVEPLGKQIRLVKAGAVGQPLTVVGVIPDVAQNFRNPLERDPVIYLPYAQDPQRFSFVVARTRVPPATLAEAFRREVQAVDENLPVYDVGTLENHLSRNRLSSALFGGIMTVFAGIALLLAIIGLYAVIAHSVSQRTQEIGIRIAMGGTTRDIVRLVFAQGLRPLAIGFAIGLPLAFAAGRALRGILLGVSPADPAILSGVLLLLVVVGAAGCAIPARRAIRVDPAVTLRRD